METFAHKNDKKINFYKIDNISFAFRQSWEWDRLIKHLSLECRQRLLLVMDNCVNGEVILKRFLYFQLANCIVNVLQPLVSK